MSVRGKLRLISLFAHDPQCCQLQKRGLGRREDTIRPKIQSLGHVLEFGAKPPKKFFGPESKFLGLIFNILPKYLIYCDF